MTDLDYLIHGDADEVITWQGRSLGSAPERISSGRGMAQ
jgi:hypothetical protein